MTTSSWSRLAGASFALLWLAAVQPRASARSASNGRFVLEVRACPEVSTASVRHILGIEIGDLLVEEGQPSPAGSDRLTIRCADNVAWVEAASDQGTGAVDRTFRLDDFPGDAAPRALALAGLELLASLSPALRARIHAKQMSPEPPAIVERPRPEPAPEEPRLHLGVAAAWRIFPVGHGVSAWGGQGRLGWHLGRRCYVGADAEVDGAAGRGALGEIRVLLLSGAAWFGGRAGGKDFGGALGVGGRMGLAHLSGNAYEPARTRGQSVVRPWGGPMASAVLHASRGRVALALGLETGWAFVTVEGQSERSDQTGLDTAVAVRGPWAALTLGAAIWR